MAIFKSKLTNRFNKIFYRKFRIYKFSKINVKNKKKSNFFLTDHGNLSKIFGFRNVIPAFKFFQFFLLYRKFFKIIYGPNKWSNKNLCKFHKIQFKHNKKRHYNQSFFINIELRVVSVLFKARIINRIKVFKKLLLHRSVLCNGLNIHNYKQFSNPMDMITYPSKVRGESSVLNDFDHAFSVFKKNLTTLEFSLSLSSVTRKIIRKLRKKELSGLNPILPFFLHKSNNRLYSYYYNNMNIICTKFFYFNFCVYNNVLYSIRKGFILKFGYHLRNLGSTSKFSNFYIFFFCSWLNKTFQFKSINQAFHKKKIYNFNGNSNLVKIYLLAKF